MKLITHTEIIQMYVVFQLCKVFNQNKKMTARGQTDWKGDKPIFHTTSYISHSISLIVHLSVPHNCLGCGNNVETSHWFPCKGAVRIPIHWIWEMKMQTKHMNSTLGVLSTHYMSTFSTLGEVARIYLYFCSEKKANCECTILLLPYISLL